MPTKETPDLIGAEYADGYGYDARVLPRKNVLLTTSFTGWNNYTRDFGDLVKDPEAMKQFGDTMVLWNFHTRQPKKVFSVPGAPLEIRWAWGEQHNYAFTATALTSKLWLCYEDNSGEWQAKEVATIGGEGGVLPVDISLSADDRTLFVSCFGDGKCRVFDVSNPHQPRQICEQAHRPTGQHGVAKLGREAALLHQLAAGALGQEGRGQRAVPARLRLGRQGSDSPRSRWTSPRSNSAVRTTCSSAQRRWATDSSQTLPAH